MDNIKIAIELISEKSKIKPLPDDCLISDLGIDSLDFLEIVVKIEDKTHLSFTTEEIADCNKLSDVINLLNKKSE